MFHCSKTKNWQTPTITYIPHREFPADKKALAELHPPPPQEIRAAFPRESEQPWYGATQLFFSCVQCFLKLQMQMNSNSNHKCNDWIVLSLFFNLFLTFLC